MAWMVGSEARRETECTLFMAFHILNNLFVSCICVANLISCAANLLNMTIMMANIITIYRGSVCASETAWGLYMLYMYTGANRCRPLADVEMAA